MTAVSAVGEGVASAAAPPAAPRPRPHQSTALWGVDTISPTSASFLHSVDARIGAPQFIGRYLVFKHATPLSGAEAALLHDHEIPILLIASPANTTLTTASAAVIEARSAVARARNLRVPRGVAIFRDVETSYTIRTAYIEAWYSTVKAAGYTPGFYANPLERGQFSAAYCAAVTTRPAIASTALYSNENEQPGYGFARSEKPAWSGARPGCPNTTVVWQYKENFTEINVDVDEMNPRFTDELWAASARHPNTRPVTPAHPVPAHPAPAHRAAARRAPAYPAPAAPARPAQSATAASVPVAVAPSTSPARATASDGDIAHPFEPNAYALWPWLGPGGSHAAGGPGLS